jgi:predicted ATP-dependent protease
VTDYNPTYYNILGKVEYENEFGTMTTDFTMIKSGLFHQANGGYLILQAKDILNNIQSWEALKRVLRTREIAIENMKEQMGLIAVSTLKPEPIPVDVKVILVGSEYIFQILYQYDEEFKKLFKIKADFDAEMDRNSANTRRLAQFISAFCNREKSSHFEKSGVAKVVEYSSRLVEDQNKLSTRFNDIVEILSESAAWAEIEGCSLVNADHVKKAIQEKIYRSNKYDKKLLKLLEDGTIMVDTEGEVEMSGTSHSKGIMILGGYIGQKYAQDIPLSLTASLCFEQLYGGVDGDSASSAELYAVLSSLAEVPIKQNFAVTGSVNQKGEIQPIGGVTEKIEGFFELCKLRGLNGEHGVIIPHQNIKNLVLNDEVVEACKEGKFNVYAVKDIDEGIEILTGKKAGTKNENGKYPAGTINHLVYEKLKKFSKTASNVEKHTRKSR